MKVIIILYFANLILTLFDKSFYNIQVFFAFLLLGIFSGALSAPMDMEQNNTNLELISELFGKYID